MSNLEMRHLESFLAVAEEGNFTRAALRLHIAQPPLSIRIRELEGILKLRLFDRTTRRVCLTPSGRTFLAKLQVSLQALNMAVAAAREVDQGITGSLRVGYTSIASDSVLPKLIYRFHTLHPQVSLDILGPLTTGNLVASLMNNDIDCALCFLPLANERLDSHTLIATELALVLPRGHLLARTKKLSLKEIAEEPFVTYPANVDSHLRAAVDAEWARAKLRPRIVKESGWSQTLLCLVAAGAGVAMLPKELQKRGVEGIEFVALYPRQTPLHLGIAWRKGDFNVFLNNFRSAAQECFPQRKKG